MVDQLAPLIRRAAALPRAFDRLKSGLAGPMLAGNDFPLVTLHKLEVMARVQYRAGLALLKNLDLAYAAEVHVRTLLEFMAQTAWITGRDSPKPQGTAKCRSICLELGMARRQNSLVSNMPVRFHRGPNTAEGTANRVAEFEALRMAESCRCKARESGAVLPTLKSIAALAPNMALYPWLFETASLAIHQVLYDRMIQEVSRGVSDYVQADYQHRASLLTWLVHPYGVALTQILELESDERARRMLIVIARVLADPLVGVAVAGKLD